MEFAPLQDITVLELGSSVAGPFATRTLAGFGAKVLKVEPPDVGDPSRHWGANKLGGVGLAYQACNRDKRSITVDFSDAAELARLKRLIAEKVDVIVQNLRPGVAERFGIDASAARAANKGLIYCVISAFGPTGPLASRPGYDPLMQAYGGLVDATGEAGRGPVRLGAPVIDFGTGMWATIGVLAALQMRAKTGAGCVVDAAMFETALAYQTASSAMIEAGDGPPRRSGLDGPIVAPNAGFDAADGKIMITVGANRQFARLAAEIGAPDLADDPRFRDNANRLAHLPELNARIGERIRTQARDYWVERFDAAAIPCAPILALDEVLRHAQTDACGILQPSPDGAFRITGAPLRFDGERPAFKHAAPALGEANQTTFAFMDD